MRLQKIDHEFVQYIPDELEEGKIYITVEFATAVHKCCCGCGNKVVTPLSPTDWELRFNGESISLEPSIGNWSFPCQSHYWIKRNQVRWAQGWSESKIDAGRARDRLAKEKYFEGKSHGKSSIRDLLDSRVLRSRNFVDFPCKRHQQSCLVFSLFALQAGVTGPIPVTSTNFQLCLCLYCVSWLCGTAVESS